MTDTLTQETINDLLDLRAKLLELASRRSIYIGFRPSSSILEELIREERTEGYWQGIATNP